MDGVLPGFLHGSGGAWRANDARTSELDAMRRREDLVETLLEGVKDPGGQDRAGGA